MATKITALIFVLLFVNLGFALEITDVSTLPDTVSSSLIGSCLGGTTLYIKGTGFEASDASKNSVTVGIYPCSIAAEGVSLTTIVCVTGSTGALEDLYNQDIKVTVIGQSKVTAAKKFSYLISQTPYLYAVSPSVSYGGNWLYWYGVHRISNLMDGRVSSTVRGMYVGQSVCNNLDVDQQSINPNALQSIKTRQPQSQKGGKYSLTEHVVAGYSTNYALTTKSTLGETSEHQFVVLPAIKSFTNEGAIGGNIISIMGSGFSPMKSQISVQVDDIPCEVTESTTDQIVCTLPEKNTQSSEMTSNSGSPIDNFESGSGFKYQRYNFSGVASNLNNLKSLASGMILVQDSVKGQIKTIDQVYGTQYGQIWKGYFVASVDGEYTFRGVGDDAWAVYISNDTYNSSVSFNDNDHLLKVETAQTGYVFPNYYETDMGAAGEQTLTLAAYNRYYMEVYHVQKAGVGFFELGIEVPNTDTSIEKWQSHQVQKFTTEIVSDPQIVEFLISRPDNGTIQFKLLEQSGQTILINQTMTVPAKATASEFCTGLKVLSLYKNYWTTCTLEMKDDDNLVTDGVATPAVYFKYTVTIQYWRSTQVRAYEKKFQYKYLSTTGVDYTNSVVTKPIITTIQEHSPLLTGTFTMEIGSIPVMYGSSTDIPYNIGAEGLRDLLRKINGFELVEVRKTGYSSYGATWIIYFIGFNEDIPDIVYNAMNLVGGTGQPTISSETRRQYSSNLLVEPIDYRFMSTAASAGSIRVTVNEVPSVCLTDCAYTFLTVVPQVATSTMTPGSKTMTIELTDPLNQNVDLQLISVTLDSQPCTNLAGTMLSFTCDLPENTDATPIIRAGDYKPKVFIQGIGQLQHQVAVVAHSFPLALSAVTPNTGGLNGGYKIVVTGTGFPSDTTSIEFTMCGSVATISQISNIEATLVVPKCAAAATETITATYGSLTATSTFDYIVTASTFQITSIDPTSASPVLKATMEIVGTGFGTDMSLIEVWLANATTDKNIYQMRVLELTDTYIKTGISGGLPGDFEVKVIKDGEGRVPANPETADDFSYEVVISSISPTTGSVYGGTLLTISGINFIPDDKLESMVTIGEELNQLCTIETITKTQITCRTPPKHADEASGDVLGVLVNNKLIIDSTCSGTCDFSYIDEAAGPVLDSISETSMKTGTLTFTGERFGTTCEGVLFNRVTKVETVVSATSCTDTQLVINVPALESGYYYAKVRVDPIGQTNPIQLTIGMEITGTNIPALSVKGGQIKIQGTGFPITWTNTHYTDMSLVSGGKSLALDVVSTSASEIVLNIPAGTNGKSYTFSLVSPTDASDSQTFTQTNGATPTVSLTSAASVAPGTSTIVLTTTTLPATQPQTVAVYSISNPNKVINIDAADFTYSNPTITFDVEINSGKYGFKLYDDVYGWYTCASQLQVTKVGTYTIANTATSFNGGRVTITGSNIGIGATVQVNGQIGTYISGDNTEATFEIPKLITPLTQDEFSLTKNKTIDLTGKTTWGDSAGWEWAFDKEYSTSYASSLEADCNLGVDIGQNLGVQLTRIRYFPSSSWAVASTYIKGGKFQVSNDNSSWTDVATIDQTVHAGWNTLMIVNNDVFRYVRFTHDETSHCKLIEFELTGIVMSSTAVTDTDSHVSDLIFNDGVTTQTFSGVIEYKNNTTPIITDVTPKNGDVFGGYDITLTGTYLDLATPVVMIDGQECTVVASSATEINCTVPSRTTLPEKVYFSVDIGGSSAIIQQDFRYVLRWSDVRTWGTDLPPIADDLVYVPEGMHLLVDQSTPILKAIIVEGGVIEFADESDMVIQAELITLRGGKFIAGTEANPYQNDLTFIMHGNYWLQQQPMYGNKGIGCFECDFSMIGKTRLPTWTTLAATINVGDNSFTVTDDIDWTDGEVIVVASTSYDHNEAQEMTIASVSGKVVTVKGKFKYKHFSVVETYGSDTLEMKAEVALLTRNIKMMGDDDSVSMDYGSHLMLAGSAENGLVGKIAYTQFTKCGQPQIVGRYCHHFHMNGDVPDSYSKGNSVHHSMARILTIHGVHFLHVSWNVGYKVKGHNFFIQDGIETNNVLEYNLAISSLSVNNMMQTDISVASFWVTNPSNHLRFNRAAGSDFYGFWYQIKERPDGPSATEDVCPQGNPMGESHDNVAHSNVRFGLRIFRLASRQFPCKPIRNDGLVDPWSENPSIESRFYNYVTYKNGESGLLAEETGHTLFENFVIAESVLAGMQFYRNNLTATGIADVTARNIVIIGKSTANFDTNASKYNGFGTILPRSGVLIMDGIRYHEFTATQTIWQACSKCDDVLLYTNTGARYTSSNIEYSGVNGKFYNMLGLKRDVFYDLDGSLTNGQFDSETRGQSTLVFGFNHLFEEPNCKNATATSDWDNAVVCSGVKIKQVMFTNMLKKSEFNSMPIKVKPIASMDVVVPQDETFFTTAYSLFADMQPMDKSGAYSLPFVAGQLYNVWWGSGIDFTHVAMVTHDQYGATDDAVLFKFNYTDNRELYEIGSIEQGVKLTKSDYFTKSETLLDASTCSNGAYYHVNGETVKHLQVCASGKDRSTFEYISINAIYCRYLCPAPPGTFIKQDFVRNWSNATQWPGGVMPADGDNVSVNGNWTIMMDVQPARFNFLEVEGDIHIVDGLPNVNASTGILIEANYIWIKTGSIYAGSSSDPLVMPLQFKINGMKTDPSYTVDPFLSANKLVAVTGNLHLYGSPPSTTWTRLTSFANAGSTSITVSGTSGWVIGDYISIAPSFTARDQFEKVQITGISGNTVTFTPALQYNHYGANSATITKTYGTLDTRAGVAHLTRNIKFTAGSDTAWGYVVAQHSYTNPQNPNITLTGHLILKGVEFSNGGQYDTEKAAIYIKNIAFEYSSSVITQSSFHNCQDFCMNIQNAYDFTITNNVFYNARKFHVQAVDMVDFSFKTNLMIGVTKRTTTVFKDFIACVQAYKTNDQSIEIKNNVCQGSAGHGFAIPTVPCADIDNYPFTENTVGSAEVGFILGKSSTTCIAATKLFAYATQIGQIMNPVTSEVQFRNFIMTDNQRAITLRIGGTSNDKTAYVNDSYIAAISRPTCTQCYGSSATTCSDLKGLQLLTVGSNSESMPDKFGAGFDVICKFQTIDAKGYLFNMQFAQFKETYSSLPQCTNNDVFVPHRGATDITGSHHLWDSTCNQCEPNSLAEFTAPSAKQLGWFGGCGTMLCTGYNNYMIFDHNGTFFPSPLGKGVLLANNSWVGQGESSCTKIEAINGYYCSDTKFGVLAYESIAPDHDTRVMWPVSLKYEGGLWTSKTNAWIEWEWQGGEPLNRRKGRFLSIMKLEKTYNMSFVSEPPSDMQFAWQRREPGGTPTDWAIIKMHYPRPNSIRVQANGVTVKPIVIRDGVPVSDIDETVCGSNKFFYDNYTVHFAVNGDNCKVRVSLVDSIQLTARFSIAIDDFFNDDGATKFINRMAALLGITDTSRIKIVGVYTGSTIVTAQISTEDIPVEQSTSTTSAANSAVQVRALRAQVDAIVNDNSFAAGMEAEGLGTADSISVSTILVTEESEEGSEDNTGLIIGIVVGTILAVCIVIVSGICYMRKRAKIGQLGNEELPFDSDTHKEGNDVNNNKVSSDENFSIVDLRNDKKTLY